MWFTEKGEPERHVKIAAKMATIIGCGPMRYQMVRGKISGYMSIRTRATDEERSQAVPLYSVERRTYQ